MTAERTSKWGHTIIVDDEDADLLPDVCGIKTANTYVHIAGVGTMGRVILARKLGYELLPSDKADHINLNKMDNRRENLRLATSYQNSSNRSLNKNNVSGYKGVGFDKNAKARPYIANISVQGVAKPLGKFDNALDAHRVYAIAALTYHKEFANLGANSPFLGMTLDQLEAPVIQLALPLKDAA